MLHFPWSLGAALACEAIPLIPIVAFTHSKRYDSLSQSKEPRNTWYSPLRPWGEASGCSWWFIILVFVLWHITYSRGAQEEPFSPATQYWRNHRQSPIRTQCWNKKSFEGKAPHGGDFVSWRSLGTGCVRSKRMNMTCATGSLDV